MGNGYGSCERVVAGATVNSSVPSYTTRIARAWKGGELGAAYNFGYVFNALYQPGYDYTTLPI